jgi:hypothetical protein
MAGALGAVAIAALTAQAAFAATVHVQNTHNAGPGSLRRAVAQANPGDTIVVPAGTYRLRTGELLIEDPLTIKGAGASKTIVNARGESRVMELTAAADPVVISGLTITGGREQYGGGIMNAGQLTLRRDVLRGNRAAGESFNSGGGIQNTGTLKLIHTVMRHNRTSASAEGFGGAIGAGSSPPHTTGPVTILRSRLVRNSAPVDGFGGAISWQTSNNTQDASLTIAKSTLAFNTAIGGSLFSAPGGAIFFNPYDSAGVEIGLEVRSSTFAHNRAVTPGSQSWGGAIAFQPRVFASGGSAPLTLVNSTITENIAGGQGGSGYGGGIWISALANTGGTVVQTFTNNTIARNQAAGGGVGGGIYFDSSGSAPPGPPSLLNTIVAQNSAGTGPDCSTAVNSAGHNLERHQSCGLVGPGDQQDTNPMLKPLDDNGGLTKTMALRPGSPAKNRGANLGCPGRDQRGVHRPQGPRCDIGAFEAK